MASLLPASCLSNPRSLCNSGLQASKLPFRARQRHSERWSFLASLDRRHGVGGGLLVRRRLERLMPWETDEREWVEQAHLSKLSML